MKDSPLPFVPANDTLWTPPDLPIIQGRFDHVYLDCETNGLDWHKDDRAVGMALLTPDDVGRYIPWGHRGGGNLPKEQVQAWAERELRGIEIRNIRTKFDVHMMRVSMVDLVTQGCRFYDVAHSKALLDDHRYNFNLDLLAKEDLGASKLDSGPKDGIADLPAGVIAPYAIQDVRLVKKLREHYMPQIAAQNLDRVQAIENRVIEVVVEMERNGMPLNMDLLVRWEAESKRILEKMQWELYRLVGFNVNPDSWRDMARLFILFKEDFRRTPKGTPSFPAEDVKAAAERHPAILLAYRIGKLLDLRSKYLVKYLNEAHNGALYPSLNQLMTDDGGTVSGRFSCVSPNMQQVMGADKHKRAYQWLLEYSDQDFLIKRLFVPRMGQWLSADAKQIEYRLFGHFSNSESILARYRENPETDFHQIVGDMIRPVRPDITRTEVKTANFLKIFGGSTTALGNNLHIDMEAASALDALYNQQFPEAEQLVQDAKRAANKRYYVKTLYGRRCRFEKEKRIAHWENPPRTYYVAHRGHKALNAVIQGTAADINKLKVVELYDARHDLEITMRMTVHDSNESDLRNPDKLQAVRELLNTQTTKVKVPILWDVNAGPSWAEAK